MRGFINSKITANIHKKEYFIPVEEHKVWEHFQTAYDQCSSKTHLSNIKFEIVFIYPNINKTTMARIVKANQRIKLFSGNDYVIEISGKYWDMISDKSKDILLEHELEHIAVKFNKHGEAKFYLRDHNVKDFDIIINKYGNNWLEPIKNVISDDNDGEDELNIKI